MELDDLKEQWHEQKPASRKSVAEIKSMIGKQSMRIFFKARAKVMIEAMMYLLLLLVFFTGLDAEDNSFWVNGLLFVGVGISIVNNFLLHGNLYANRKADDVKQSITKAVAHFKKQLRLQFYFTLIFFAAISVFFLLKVSYNHYKLILLGVFFISAVAIRTWIERSAWLNRIKQLESYLSDLQTLENDEKNTI
jgi:hypothetical protein